MNHALSFDADAERALVEHLWPGTVRELHNVVERAAVLDAAAKAAVLSALEQSGWRRQEAAVALGVDRTTLYRWMRRLGVGADES